MSALAHIPTYPPSLTEERIHPHVRASLLERFRNDAAVIRTRRADALRAIARESYLELADIARELADLAAAHEARRAVMAAHGIYPDTDMEMSR